MTTPVVIGAAQLYLGDCLETLKTMPDKSVNCCVTSPPYYGLRDYGCVGQVGLEQTPAEYVARLVDVFAEVRRVLTDDGTCWVNLGDSYASSPASGGERDTGRRPQDKNAGTHQRTPKIRWSRPEGLKPKDLLGMPWRVAFALQADGWYLRQDIIWAKPNPMPESVTDRCTKAHEYLFLLTKSARYWWDQTAMREHAIGKNLHDLTGPGYEAPGQTKNAGNRKLLRNDIKRERCSQIADGTRNRRTVWNIATKGYDGAHFAVMPLKLVEPCILAGSQKDGIVLDPFNGSGTVGVVAVAHGRRYIGCELNPDYITLAIDRLTNAQRQQSLDFSIPA